MPATTTLDIPVLRFDFEAGDRAPKTVRKPKKAAKGKGA